MVILGELSKSSLLMTRKGGRLIKFESNMKHMKKIIALLTFCVVLTANAQDFYFSNSPFKPGVIPTESKKAFTDDEHIYGLAIYNKTLDELDLSKEKHIRENGEEYWASSISITLTASLIGTGGRQSAPVIEVDGKSFVFIHILPNPKEVYYINGYPGGIKSAYTVPLLSKKFKMFINSDMANCRFTTSIKYEKKGTFDEIKAAAVKKELYNVVTYHEDEKRAEDADDLAELTYDQVEIKLKSEHHSPGSEIDILFRYKKDNEAFCDWTRSHAGFEFVLDGAYISGRSYYVNELPFGKDLNESVSFKIVNSQNKACFATRTIALDYLGQSVLNYSGGQGRTGRKGENSSFGGPTTNGSRGGDGGNGSDIDVYIRVYKPGYIVVKSISTGLKPRYAILKMSNSKLKVFSQGGDGGYGGGGGLGDSGKGVSDGTAGRGGNGGNGGKITFHISSDAASYKSNIEWSNYGGGRGGYILHGNRGEYGSKGSSGPEARFITEKVDFTIP